jgi:hypothetical protein
LQQHGLGTVDAAAAARSTEATTEAATEAREAIYRALAAQSLHDRLLLIRRHAVEQLHLLTQVSLLCLAVSGNGQ